MFRNLGSALNRAFALALCGWMALACPRAAAEETPPVFADEEDEALDIEFLKAAAGAGKVRAQTKLADFFLAGGDYTNAVIWYRKAAEQGDVAAQLTLVSCLVTGRGTAKDPQEAARWLRSAADRIEAPAGKARAAVAATNQIAPIIMTKSSAMTNATAPVLPVLEATNAPPAPAFTRVQRSDVLQIAEPVLQEAKPVLKPYSEPR